MGHISSKLNVVVAKRCFLSGSLYDWVSHGGRLLDFVTCDLTDLHRLGGLPYRCSFQYTLPKDWKEVTPIVLIT